MKKKSYLLILSIFLFCFSIFGMAACNTGDDGENNMGDKFNGQQEVNDNRNLTQEELLNVEGKFYTLQEAYDNGYLTQEDLCNIANCHNNGINYVSEMGNTLQVLIKETAADLMRNDNNHAILEVKQEDFKILKYYGHYNGCYAVILNHPFEDVPAVIINEWITISGVRFHYTGPNIIEIWK